MAAEKTADAELQMLTEKIAKGQRQMHHEPADSFFSIPVQSSQELFGGESPDFYFTVIEEAMAQERTTGVLGFTTGASTGASDSALHVQLTLSTYATNGRFIFSAAQALHALRRFAADARWVATSCGHGGR